LDRLPTRINLARMGVQLANLLCPLCQKDVESTDHLFNTCFVAQLVRDHCAGGLGRWVFDIKTLMLIFRVFAYWVKSRALIELGKGCGLSLSWKYGVTEIR